VWTSSRPRPFRIVLATLLSSPLLLSLSLTSRTSFYVYNIYSSVDCSKNEDDDDDDDDDEIETGAVEYQGRASQVCVSVPEIDENELPALRTYSCGISVSPQDIYVPGRLEHFFFLT